MRDRMENLLEMEKAQEVGLKWRYFLFGTILKRASYNNSIFSTVMFILEFACSLFPLCYPLLDASVATESDKMSPATAIFSHSQILTYLTPKLIPTSVWMNLLMLFYCGTMISFLFCLAKPPFACFLHWFLNCKLHQVFLPWTTGALGFALYALVERPSDLPVYYGTCAFVAVLFIPYIVILCLLCFIEANSLIGPEVTAIEWFTVTPILYPIMSSVIYLVGWECMNMSRPWRIASFSIVILLLVIKIIYLFVHMPLMLFVADEVTVSQSIMMFCLTVTSILVTEEIWSLNNLVVSTLPEVCVFVLLVTHFFFDKRRSNTRHILAQLDGIAGPLTYESISSTLSSLKNEVSLVTLVKEGLLTGNRAILSDAFIQYCLRKYPTNEWFVEYITFVCSVIWSSDTDVYRFLLHYLSLDVFGISTSFILFQYVYCHMQTSIAMSPMVMRKVMKLRKTRLEYATFRRQFWRAAVHQDWKTFYQSNVQMFWIMLSMQAQMKMLDIMFPFSPVVRCELSVCYADFTYDLEKASEEFRTANLIKNSKNYIASSLFKEYSLVLSAGESNEEGTEPLEPLDYKFLSFQQEYNDANCHGLLLQAGDQYLSMHTSIYSVDRKTYSERKTDQTCLWILVFVFVASSVLFLTAYTLSLTINNMLVTRKSNYLCVVDVGERSISLRDNLVMTAFDIVLLGHIINETFHTGGDPFDYPSFYGFVVTHLEYLDSELLEFWQSFEGNSIVREIAKPAPNCSFVAGCSFPELLGMIRSVSNFFMLSGDVRGEFERHDKLQDVIASLHIWIDQLHASIAEWVGGEITEVLQRTHRSIALIICEIAWMCLAVTATVLITRSMTNSIFCVLATVQPPVLQSLSRRFDRLLPKQNQHVYQNVPKRWKPNVIIPIVLMFLVLAVYPVCLVIFLQILDRSMPVHEPWTRPTSNPLISEFLYYSRARLEFELIGGESFTPNHSCFHEILIESNNCSFRSPFFDQIPMNVLNSSLTAMIFIALIVFCVFVIMAYLLVQFYNFAHRLLKEVPNRAVQSNKLFVKLLKGKQVTKGDLSEFMDNLKSTPYDLDFFCILYLNNDGTVSRIAGPLNEFISSNAKSVDELRQYLSSNYADCVDEINGFFSEPAEGKTLTLPRELGSYMTFIFSTKPHSLIIYDDSHQSQAHTRTRLIKRLSTLEIPGSTAMERAVVVMITFTTPKELHAITSEIKNSKIGSVIDTRNHIVLVLIDANSNSQKAARDCFALLEHIPRIHQTAKIVAHIGGPITFFDSRAARTVRPRCIGECIDATRLLLQISTHPVLATRPLCEEAGIIATFESIRLASDMTFDVTVP